MNEHHSGKTIEKKAYATDFFVMVHDAVEVAVILPGDHLVRQLKPERLAGHQWQNALFREFVGHLVDDSHLFWSVVPGNRKGGIFTVVVKEQPAKAWFVDQ